ncbi:hypothetical protein C3K47_14985 [Solitalea longa]|uniref:Uncharacterized protein n=1 Tax=Solitalea longa TaxID=2079460 RepID=A0A2S4ZZD6_9SPHI|nr:efflux RND transporter periplasmic adaptor subunit [Solitalea longa]POY35367.1 hypothetical protein C3K47_14985 [Solitalea longa]
MSNKLLVMSFEFIITMHNSVKRKIYSSTLRLCSFAVTLLIFSCSNEKAKEGTHVHQEAQKSEVYSCSMHPNVRSDKPGNCPICGMPLTKIEGSDVKEEHTLHLAPVQLITANIKTDTIRTGDLNGSLTLSAKTNYNRQAQEIISAKVSGRIEQLFVRNPGEQIAAGQKLYSLYSEELQSTQQEYLISLKQRKAFEAVSVDMSNAIVALERKLELWGMNKAQIKQLANSEKANPRITIFSKQAGTVTEILKNEGEYLNEGDAVLNLSSLNDIWVEAEVFDNELTILAKNPKITVELEAYPGEIFPAEVVYQNPHMQGVSNINLLTLKIKNTVNLKPGMLAYVHLTTGIGNELIVPKSAVIYGEKMNIAWIKRPDGSFERRMVELGKENKQNVQILEGLHNGEVIVTSGVFLLNSEYILKFGTSMTHNH